jgi:hypothetical protein
MDPPPREDHGGAAASLTCPSNARAGAATEAPRPGTSRATTAPTASTAAPTHTAGTNPSTYACGEPYPPASVNTVASTATPSTPPISRIVFVAPEAWPASLGRTAPSTAFAAGANTSAMPAPAMTKPGRSAVYATSGALTAASQASPAACSARPATISGRLPMRSERTPATGATTIGIAVHGSVRIPASSGENPCATWKNCASRKIAPKLPKYIASDTPLVAAKARFPKKRIGSIGVAVLLSQATNAARSAIPAPIDASTVELVQPSDWARTIPYTTPSRPELASATPGRSSRSFGPRLSRRRASATGARAKPIGTFSQKIHCQERPSTTAPPTTGPSATPSPATPDQTPSARPRRSALKASLSSVSDSGVITAPPSPCKARAAISASVLGATAAAADASVKIPSPAANTFLRPSRSPIAAAVSRNTAKLSVYALTVHSSSSSVAPRSSRILTRALVTTRLSSVTMKRAIETIARVQMLCLRSIFRPFVY